MAVLSLLSMIERLVAEPSVSATDPALDTGNAAVIDALAEWLEHEGFACERMEVAPGKANLIATRGRGPGGLVLSGHTDTVPCDPELWTSDPFELSERDNRLYGLGVCDMLGFIAMAIEAAREFDAGALKEPLILLMTCDEETGMDGARALAADWRPSARGAVIGEPTGLAPVRMHKGCAMERLELHGRSGHSSDPALGVSALDGMHRALGALSEARASLAARHRHAHLHPAHPTLNFGRIEGGDNPNRICGRCVLDYDLRVLPGMSAADVRGELREAVDRALEGSDLRVEHTSLCEEVPPFETPADDPLVAVAERLTGHRAGGVSFGTEAPFLAGLGLSTIVLGPGDIDVAHQPDEYLALERIPPMRSILKDLIGSQCVEPNA